MQCSNTLLRMITTLTRLCSKNSQVDIEPLVDLQAKYEIEIQASAFLGTSPIRQYAEGWTMEKLMKTMENAVTFAVDHDIPVMFVTEDTTQSNQMISKYLSKTMELGVRRICVVTLVDM